MNDPVTTYLRGIASHATAWLFVCLLLPFIFGGFTQDSVSKLGLAIPLFLIGPIPLLFGSAFWMLPFFFPGLGRRLSPFYHFWVALGAFLAFVVYVDIQFAGDPLPPRHIYFAPAALGALIAFAFSCLYTRGHKHRFA